MVSVEFQILGERKALANFVRFLFLFLIADHILS